MYLSIIIPAYNSQNTIVPLLLSISSSMGITFGKIEVVIVDDSSSDSTIKTIRSFQKSKSRLTNIKIIRLKNNSGPAQARNIGVRYAKGEIVLFLDADVVVYTNTIERVIYSFRTDPDLFALTGVWDKEQKSNSFFPNFKALRDWSYWINERDPKNYYYLFSTRIAAIRRDLFLRLGGFDTTYKAALVEDIELTYRIAKRYAVVFDSKVRVSHEFENFLPVAKKYFWRSYYWSKIYRERKKFDPVATTGKEALATISAGFFVISFLITVLFGLSLELRIMNYELRIFSEKLFQFFILTSYFLILVHLLTVRKFIVFCIKEKGWWFGMKAFVTGIILYCVIISGAIFSFFTSKSH